MTTEETVTSILITSLNLGPRASELNSASPLLGAIPELDSMAVVGIITALEDHFGFTVYDDEISADSFENLGSLVSFVEKKMNE